MSYMYVILSIKLLDIMLRPKGIQALVEGLKSKCFYMWKTKKNHLWKYLNPINHSCDWDEQKLLRI